MHYIYLRKEGEKSIVVIRGEGSPIMMLSNTSLLCSHERTLPGFSSALGWLFRGQLELSPAEPAAAASPL